MGEGEADGGYGSQGQLYISSLMWHTCMHGTQDIATMGPHVHGGNE